jgi:IS5 family transposase
LSETRWKLTGCAIERAYFGLSRPRRSRSASSRLYVWSEARRPRPHQAQNAASLGEIDGHLGRCHFEGREGDAANVTVTAVGHNLWRVLG